jgi:CBS domain-containing protein
MADEGYHRLPVVADKRLLGIVTSLDFVRLVGERGLADA